MRPTDRHSFYANNWPERIWLGVGIALGAVGGAVVAWLTWDASSPWWWGALRAAFWFGHGVLLGYFVLMFAGIPVLGPLYDSRYQDHGAPFEVGAWVEVLVGPHRGRVVRVREKWQGDAVRVDLGPEAAASYGDVFGPLALIRADPASAPPAPQ